MQHPLSTNANYWYGTVLQLATIEAARSLIMVISHDLLVPLSCRSESQQTVGPVLMIPRGIDSRMRLVMDGDGRNDD